VVDPVEVGFSLSCTFVLITRTALALRPTNLEKKTRKEMGNFETFRATSKNAKNYVGIALMKVDQRDPKLSK
jgi:hypothetical protein